MTKKFKILLFIWLASLFYRIILLPSVWAKGHAEFGPSAPIFTILLIAEILMMLSMVCFLKFPRLVRPLIFIDLPLWAFGSYLRFTEDADIIRLVLSSIFVIGILTLIWIAAPYACNKTNNLPTTKSSGCGEPPR